MKYRSLVSAEMIDERLAEMGRRISADYEGKDLLLVAVLKGAFMVMADLSRHITVPVDMDFMAVSSYGDATKSSGVVRILKDLDQEISDRHVIIVEDIVDTGLTLTYLRKQLEIRQPNSLAVCALLNKVEARQVDVHIDYVGFVIPNEFVVGYGLDFDEKYRNLPYIGVLDA